MRLRYWAAFVVVVAASVTIAMRVDNRSGPPTVTSPPEASVQVSAASDNFVNGGPDTHAPSDPMDEQPSDDGRVWSRVIGPGESLDILLAEAGLAALERAEISRAIGAEYDLRRLQPGYRLSLQVNPDGAPRTAVLEVEDGLRVHAAFGANPSVRTLPPELETVVRAGEAEISSSIYAALDEAGMPTRFATDLELILDGTLDLRRAVTGGERLRIVWRENRLGDRVIGEPIIDFAQLHLGDARYEVLWPDDQSSDNWIYKDGSLERVFRQPVPGARLSSSFGLRDHPVHGGVRMHSGVDFAAELGSPVYATQPGTVTFKGRRSGYGLMVEIEHSQGVRTIFAHLSAASEAIEVGQGIAAGEEIGSVGSTGTSTAPHLHYEILVDGEPVPPLTDDRLAQVSSRRVDVNLSETLLEAASAEMQRMLASIDMSDTVDDG